MEELEHEQEICRRDGAGDVNGAGDGDGDGVGDDAEVGVGV